MNSEPDSVASPAGAPIAEARLAGETYVLLREYVRQRTGLVYGASRRRIFENRVLSRVTALGLGDANAYYRYLLFHPDRDQEFLQLASVLTNNETYFFREQRTLDALVDMLATAPRSRRIRILSAGASSGEELATLAMLLREAGLDPGRVDLHGVDLDVRMVEMARHGVYRSKSFRQVDPERIIRYFVPEGDGRKLKPSIRSHLNFRWANLVEPGTLRFPHRFDAVLVRNVLIYFDPETVELVLRNLHGLLAEEGLLVVGLSESLSHIPFLFDPIRHKGAVLYRKVPL